MHLSPDDLRTVQRILAFWAPGISVFAYGSRVHGRHVKPFSDLDLCLRGTARVPDRTLGEVRDAFDISGLPMRVDVVDWHELGEEFRALIEPDLEPVPSLTVAPA